MLVGCQSAPVLNTSVAAPASTTVDDAAEQTPELNIPEPVLDSDCNCSDRSRQKKPILTVASALWLPVTILRHFGILNLTPKAVP